jgi:hypothetical protein
MAWLPDYGVGMIAMTNLTYSGASGTLLQAFDELRKTGALQPRQLPPSTALIASRDALVRLWNGWTDAEAQKIAADNLLLDTPAATRQKEIEKMKAEVGACRAPGDLQPENWLRGKFRMECERGHVDMSFTLAPTNPPRVQQWKIMTAVALDVDARAAVERVAGWVPDNDAIAAVMNPARSSYGLCRLGDVTGGNGKTWTMVRLECARGPVEAIIRLNKDHRVDDLRLSKPSDVTCTP